MRLRADAGHQERFAEALNVIVAGLFPWQQRWLADRSKWRSALKARQLGYTHVSELDCLLKALLTPGCDVYIVSTTVGNAAKILRRIRQRWIPALAVSGHPALRLVKDAEAEIELGNGSRIYAIANEPDRMRGNVGHYFFDEFGFWEKRKLELIIDAVFPTIENKINPHLCCTIVSTPFFKDSLYYDICKKPMYAHFSRHEIDIYKAVKQGLDFDIEAVKGRITSDRWHREYCCGFLEGGTTYFSRDQLILLEDTSPYDRSRVEIYAGVDLGKINDFTAVVILAKERGRMRVLHTYLMRTIDYGKQAEIISDICASWNVESVAIDITKHASFVDQAPARLRKIAVAQNFTWDWKVEWVPRVKGAVEAQTLGADWDAASLWDEQLGAFGSTPSRVLLDDFARVVQGETPSGRVKYEVPRLKVRGAEQDGHGDGFSALLLAYWIASVADGQEADAEQIDIRAPALARGEDWGLTFKLPDMW